MRNVKKIIDLFGGLDWLKGADNYIRLEAPGFMRLVIEYVGTGPRGLPAVSVAHYGEQNGDAMRDPEIVFEVGDDAFGDDAWGPISFRNDYMGIVQEGEDGAVFRDESGKVLIRPRLVRDLKSFARLWDRNIGAQGFVDAARLQVARKESQP
jgi:hypothetical protein